MGILRFLKTTVLNTKAKSKSQKAEVEGRREQR
jgi:hypothetical protein